MVAPEFHRDTRNRLQILDRWLLRVLRCDARTPRQNPRVAGSKKSRAEARARRWHFRWSPALLRLRPARPCGDRIRSGSSLRPAGTAQSHDRFPRPAPAPAARVSARVSRNHRPELRSLLGLYTHRAIRLGLSIPDKSW